MRFFMIFLFVLAAIPGQAAEPYGDGFESGNPGDYVESQFKPEQVRIVMQDGVKSLCIADTNIRLKTVPVTPRTKYMLSFQGSFTGDIESIEDNSRFEVFAQPGKRSSVLPSREIQFLNAAGKAIGKKILLSMPWREKHFYTDVFFTPSGATAMSLKLNSGKGVTFALGEIKFKKTEDEDAINVNPAFNLGTLNYSGWQNIAAGGRILELDGKTVLDTKYGSFGMAFPLRDPGTYALSAKATGNGFNSCVIVNVFDSEGKKLMSSRIREYEKPNYFVPPEEAEFASILVYSCFLEEVRLVRVGDENAMGTFLKK